MQSRSKQSSPNSGANSGFTYLDISIKQSLRPTNKRTSEWQTSETGPCSDRIVHSVGTQIVRIVERYRFLSWHVVNAEREPLSGSWLSGCFSKPPYVV